MLIDTHQLDNSGFASFRSSARRSRQRALNGDLWTAAEMRVVQKLYPNYDAILMALPHRTYWAVRNFAQNYGIALKRHVWTGAEVSRLRALYTRSASKSEILEAFSGLTWRQIDAQARFRGVKKPRTAPKLLGIPILDAIRRRAFELNYSFVDLDAECHSKRYFQSTPQTINWRYVGRAIEYLGGAATVQWTNPE
jgi:hypothetical protein